MTDDEAIALYGMVKKMAQAMAEREAALGAKTAALEAAIADLQQLPATLGKQTSQYIEAGVRASIKEDFKWPIEDALKGPIEELHYATNQARDVMGQVRSEAKLQSWTAVALMVVLGIALGAAATSSLFGISATSMIGWKLFSSRSPHPLRPPMLNPQVSRANLARATDSLTGSRLGKLAHLGLCRTVKNGHHSPGAKPMAVLTINH